MLRKDMLTWVLLAAVAGSGATGVPAAAGLLDEADALVVEMREIVRTVEDCDREADDCSVLVFRYPEVISAPTEWSRERLPELIQERLAGPMYEDSAAGGIEAIFVEFEAEYLAMREEFPEYVTPWALEREVTVLHTSRRVVSLMSDEYSYLGGAHPNTARGYWSYDIETGEPLALYELFSPAAIADLERHVETEFRRIHGVPPGSSLEEAGFWFDKGFFELNDNWAIDADGIVFYYNPYEVAPYAAGPTEVHLPTEVIAPLALPTGPLADGQR